MHKRLIAFYICTIFCTPFAHALDLLQAYQMAQTNDAQYRSALAAYQAAQEKLPQAQAVLLPNINLSGNDTQIDPKDAKTYTSKTYKLELRQAIINIASFAQFEQVKLFVTSSQTQLLQSQQELILRTSTAYFDLLTAYDNIDVLSAQKKAISEQLAFAKRNFEIGSATITDTHEAQARYDLATAQAIAAQSDLEIKQNALQQIIGNPPDKLAKLKPTMTLTLPEPNNMDAWVQSALNQNYSVINAQLNLEIAQRAIAVSRAGHYPTLDLVANRNHANTNVNNNNSSTANSNTIGVVWNIPLFAGFGVNSRVRESIALYEKAREDLNIAQRDATQLAKQFYLGVTSGFAQVKALEAAQTSSQSALAANVLGYKVGVRINIDVLNAQQQLFSTQKNLARARYDTIINSLKLKSVTSKLGQEDVAGINALLQ